MGKLVYLLLSKNFHCLDCSEIMGIISVTNMTSKITKGKVKPTDSVTVMLYNGSLI